MAWNPSKKQISTYEQLLKRYNKQRKQIERAHRQLEQITPSGRMPSLVIPERQRKMTLRQIRMSGRRMFAMKIRQLKKIVHGGLQEFYNDYKKSYLELYRNYIIQDDPEGYQNRFYSPEQIAEAERLEGKEMAQFMHDYNRIVTMNGTVFTFLVKAGKIPEFRYLYRQFENDFEMYENYAQQFHKGLNWARNINPKVAKEFLSGAPFSKWSKQAQDVYMKWHDIKGYGK